MNIILVGPQGSGKGTQAKLLVEKFGLTQISTGDLIREGAAKGDPDVQKIKEYTDSGKLAPDEYIMNLIKKKIEESDGVIFDGVPRNLSQAEALDEITQIDYVIELNISDEESVKRLSQRRVCMDCNTIYGMNKPSPKNCPCGSKPIQRDDDKPEAIRKRLQIYHDRTEPLLEYYKPRDIVHRVDGSGTVQEVFEELCKVIEQNSVE